MAKLGDILEHPCPECGDEMVLRNSRFGKFYGCVRYPECRATHGAHRDGKPLGIPANKETKDARIRAHEAFDRLWKGGGPMTRGDAYRWLREQMGMAPAACHIGMFGLDECDRVMRMVESRLSR